MHKKIELVHVAEGGRLTDIAFSIIGYNSIRESLIDCDILLVESRLIEHLRHQRQRSVGPGQSTWL
jgi:hypothetical protein